MNKRRRTSSVASRGVEDEDEPQQAEPSRKRKRLDPMEIVQLVYDVIRNQKKDDGSLLCDAFIRAPKRRQEPGYYEVVTNPIDLLKVQQKIKTDEYENVEQLQADIELLVNNTKAFYKRQSTEYKDATELMDLFLSTKNKLLDNSRSTDDSPVDAKGKIVLKVGKLGKKSVDTVQQQQQQQLSARQLRLEEREREQREREQREKEQREKEEGGGGGDEEELNMCEELFTAVMSATDPATPDNRPLHTMFQLLPSVKRYPKYYEVIENPIDLRTIARKIQDGKYATLADMDRDLTLMTKNACTFNEPGSQIYKDAKTLKKIISSKKIEIEHGKCAREGKTSERIRNKRLRGGQSLSAITAALPDEDDDSEEDEGEGGAAEGADEPDNPRWQLFQAVKNATSPQGALLSEPFWKLPSKRYYPDYYKEIRNAISLMQIGKKLKRGDYGTVSEVAGDMNIMFENAKKYNRPDSKLYKDAVKLQKVMQSKVQELLECDHQYSDSEEESAVGGGDSELGGDQQPPAKRKSAAKTETPHRCITRGKYMHNIPLKRRLYSLCKCLIDYVCEDGRQPMLMFMEKPSKKLYPDYYEVIENPIDMLTIEANIKAEKYTNQDEILNDFKLMFRNCRQYNEEHSMIYEDASRLEKVLMERVKELGPQPDTPLAAPTPGNAPTPTPKKVNKVVKQTADTTPRNVAKTKRTTTQNNMSPNMMPSDRVLPHATLQKMRTLYNTLRDYRDPRGRQLSLIFLKLPSKIEYPDYYEVIKRPINLEQISHKLKMNGYEGLDEIVSDFVLMFDNACKYNEPDSQIYKDALMLQRVCLQTKLQLREDEEAVPDVISAVQELLTSLFTAVYNHQDEEGRCFSDSMAELPEHDEVDGKRQRALSLDLIKRRLDGMQYRRLDLFQEDLFSCMERARRLSPTDSQVFEDSVELQSFFIRQRDELCRNGDLLHSPALNYTLLDLSAAVDVTRREKQAKEQADAESSVELLPPSEEQDENETRSSEDTNKAIEDTSASARGTADNAMSFNQQVYRIGDFVYAEAKERGNDPMLLNIQRLWTSVDGQQMLYGNQFYRPRETYHVTTRKFLEKEVFKTDQHVALPLNKVLGRCCVLSVKDYFRAKPDGFDEKDIYVCESRYSSKARAFKKIKNWPSSLNNAYKLEPREKVLEPIRNMSVFRERVEKHKEEIAELEEQEKLVIKEKPNVPLETNNELKVVYYEQYNHNGIVIKTGDCVYLKADNKQAIAQIDTIWTNVNNQAFIRGPWMLLPKDLRNCAMRIFYKQEIFLSTVEDTIPVDNITGKCAVLEHSEYISCRPTEIAESDVYLCESKFDEAKQLFRELPRDGLKKYTHSSAVTQDEIYFFRRLLNPPRVGVTGEVITLPTADRSHSQHHHSYMHHFDSLNSASSPVLPKVEADMILEDSLDGVGGPPSVSSIGDTGPSLSTPTSSKKSSKPGKKLVTGYILYSGDIRKGIASSNPDKGFGEVSRMVGNEWRKLPTSEKIAYEEKAARLNEETTAKFAEQEQQQQQLMLQQQGGGGMVGGVGAGGVGKVGGGETCAVFECCWDNCDHQFEDMVDCIEHAVADSSGHVQQFFAAIPPSDVEFQCQWKTCIRMKKQCAPFPSLHRLARHVKEVHIMKSTGRVIPIDQRSKNYTPSRKPKGIQSHQGAVSAHPHTPTGNSHMHRGLTSNLMGNHARSTPSPHSQNGHTFTQKPLEPLFVTVPPRPQRLLHSEAYIKYIENLSAESRSISNWEKQLRAQPQQMDQSPAIDAAKLPAHWLANGTANHGNVINALWTLRDYMFRDALGLSKMV